MAKEKTTRKQYIVIARSTETIKELYAQCGVRKIPFDTPVVLSDKEVATLKRQKEAIQVEKQITVREIMEQHGVSQDKALAKMQQIENDPNIGGKKIQFVEKFIVTPA